MNTPIQTLPLPAFPLAAPAATKSTHFTVTAAIASDQLKQLHAQILRRSNLRRPSTTPLLLRRIYSAPNLDYAISVFRDVPPGTSITQALIKFLRLLSRSDEPEHALQVFDEMLNWDGMRFDRFYFPPVLKAATRIKGLDEGLQIHGLVVKLRLDLDPFIQTALVGMYAACRRIVDARLVFDRMSYRDIVAWNMIIDGCCQSGLFNEALKLFEEMKSSGIKPDEMLLSTILSACGRAGNITLGKKIHEYIVENNMVVDSHLMSALINMYASSSFMDTALELFQNMSPKNLVVSTSMITWYSRVGQIDHARAIFDQIDERDLVCWSAMISGYANTDQPRVAIDLFKEMQAVGLKPDQVTVLSVISACSHLGVLSEANSIHLYAEQNGFGKALPVNNALIDMYAKCGSLEKSIEVFENIHHQKNVISWTSMIGAFAMHGDARNALRIFNQMKDENFEPNEITFIWVLYACSHGGLVKEGEEIFASMVDEHNIVPRQEHYGCMVDLFGRANLMRDALVVIETMPMPPNVVIWGSLMSACRVHGETDLGEFAAEQLLKLDPDHDGAHVLLSNIYAKQGRFEKVGELRNSMRVRGISKERGCSRIESKNEVHEFLVGDRTHEESDRIYEKLDEVVEDLRMVGYVPSPRSVIVDLEEEEKREVVVGHSEKLALCYGLIRKEEGSCIRIVKNLRVCEDCHAFMKLASRIYGREIVVRDRTRFHRFSNGVCTCKDYW